MRLSHRLALVSCVLLAASPALQAPAAAPRADRAAPNATPPAGTSPGGGSTQPAPRVIEDHVGIPGVVYVGQPLKELLAMFPGAKVTPFAQQEDAVTVQIPEAGISCLVVGPTPDDFKVASAGFSFEPTFGGGGTNNRFRTSKGIGAGSTVNDLLEAYGKPSEVTGERATNPALKRKQSAEDPNAPKKYLYPSPDGGITTYFLVRGYRVLRVVINQVEPLDRHILKRRPEEPPRGSPPPSAAPSDSTPAPPGSGSPPR
ncbi:MAG TPA: hypothetical protein VFT43_14125 [Candidatus Polarisedimenticolia bacterium]|nr:hypothetical protein [Candidatus Polarisedimenticolia bacterium]